jgi:hypothetical protein
MSADRLIVEAHKTLSILSRTRGKAHDVLVGEWVRCWNELDHYHLAFNPAPVAGSHTADIMFLEPEYNEIKNYEPSIWKPVGVAEIENNRNKWSEKLESLSEYIKEYQLKFVLLCVRVYQNSRDDMKSFDQLKEKVIIVSRNMPNVEWILYRWDESPWSKDMYLITFKPDPEAEVYAYKSICGGEGIIIKNGEVILRSSHDTDL